MKSPILALSATVALVANRDSFKVPADGWLHLMPFGEVPGPMQNPDGRHVEVVQVLDKEAGAAVLSAFRNQAAKPNFGGVLVDIDHFSLDPSKESRAAAWIDELAERADGLWFKGRITNSGRTALEGGDYRFISPVLEFDPRTYQAGERVRPTGLHSAGLTNDPRIKGGVPLSNRQTAATAERSENVNPPVIMKSVLTALGLADDASEASAVSALQTITNRATTAERDLAALKTAHTELLASAVEADLNTYAPVITNRDAVKAALIANRAGTLALLAGLKANAVAPARITNRDAAKTPEQLATEATGAAAQASAQRIANRAHELVRAKKIPFATAFAEATREAGGK